MNVAIIGNDGFTMIKFRLDLMKKIALTHHVYAAAPNFTSEEICILKLHGIEPVMVGLNRFGLNPVKEILSIFSLIRFFLDYKIDISFSYFIKPVLYSTFAAKVAGVKRRIALIEGLGYFFTGNSLTFKNRILKHVISILFKIFLPMANRVVFLNKDDQNEVSSIVSSLQTFILGGIGVDLNEYAHFPSKIETETNFLIVARILREKGIFEFIDAANMTSLRFPNAKFWIIGGLDDNPGGINEQDLKKLFRGNIVWAGHVHNVKEWLIKSHVFVLPSYREGIPRSTQEAMAIGRAVITTDVQGCRETVIPGKNGFLIRPKSSKELSEAFEKYLNNAQLIIEHGETSRKIAETNFDVHVKNEILKGILEGNLI